MWMPMALDQSGRFRCGASSLVPLSPQSIFCSGIFLGEVELFGGSGNHVSWAFSAP